MEYGISIFFMNIHHKTILHPDIINFSVIREISDAVSPGVRWQVNAVRILHDVSEVYMTSLFADSNLAAIHVRRVTLQKSYIQLVRKIRGETE